MNYDFEFPITGAIYSKNSKLYNIMKSACCGAEMLAGEKEEEEKTIIYKYKECSLSDSTLK